MTTTVPMPTRWRRPPRGPAAVLAVALVAFAAGRLGAPIAPRAGAAAGQTIGQTADQTADPARLEQEEVTLEASPEARAWIEAGRPGAHHRRIDLLAGEWTAGLRMWARPGAPPIEMPGTVSRRWILEGRYLREELEAEVPLGVYRGVGYLGHNNFDGQYELVWMENQSTAIGFDTGTYDPDRKVLSTRGRHRDPVSGRAVVTRSELDLSDADRHTVTAWAIGPDGREFKRFEAVYERQ